MILPLESQCSSLESSKRLKSLGVRQDSLFVWAEVNQGGKEWKYNIVRNDFQADIEYIAAFTCAELGELMPKWAATFKANSPEGIIWTAEDGQSPEHKHIGATEAEARAKMLIYLIEQGLMEVPGK